MFSLTLTELRRKKFITVGVGIRVGLFIAGMKYLYCNVDVKLLTEGFFVIQTVNISVTSLNHNFMF